MKRHLYLLSFFLLLSPFILAQHFGPERLSNQIHRQKARSVINAVAMFEDIKNKRLAKDSPNRFRLDPQKLERISREKPDYWKTNLPIGNRQAEVELIPVRVVTDDFVVSIGNKPSDHIRLDAGLRYIGKVSGQPQSQVIVSIRNGILTGDIQTDQGSFTLHHNPSDGINTYQCSPTTNPDNKTLACYSEGDGVPYTAKQLAGITNARMESTTALEDVVIRLYVEVDKPKVVPYVAEDVAAFVNKTLDSIAKNIVIPFQNEGVTIEVSEMKLWLYETPYTTKESDHAKVFLPQFKNMMKDGFNGDLAMLYTQGGGGVAAGTTGLCHPDFSMRTTVCCSFNSMAHEVGHLLGSSHTHDCVWNGNATALDGCDPSVGPCAQGPIPAPGKGTIMSYCHLTEEVGRNLNIGFGEQPGNVIRNNVLGAYCLSHRDEEPGTYCEAKGLSTQHPLNPENDAYITKVTLGDYINNSGDNGGYGNFINNVISLSAGTTVPISITLNEGRPEFAKQDEGNTLGATLVSVWIDFDGDFDFSEPSELVYSGGSSTAAVFSGNAIIPDYAIEGTHRMRVMFNMDYSYTQMPCEVFALGEVEDYTVNIMPQIDPGNCGTPQVVSSTTLSPTKVEIKVSPVPTASSYSVRYYGMLEGLDLAGLVTSSSSSILLNDLRPATQYNYEVRANCTNGASSAFDNESNSFRTNTCAPPTPSVKVVSTRSVDLEWIEDPSRPVWEARFRPMGGDTWIKVWNPSPPVRLNALDEDTTYEFQLGSSCSPLDSVNLFYSKLVPFKAGDQWEVVVYVRDQWADGVTVDVTVKNLSMNNVEGWDVEFRLDNAQIYYFWNTILSGNGQPYIFSNTSYNGLIPKGGDVKFGFNASQSSSFLQPRSAKVNGFPARLVVYGKVNPPYYIGIQARGTSGEESIDITVGGRKVATYELSDGYSWNQFWTAEQGGINVYFTNDAPGRDVQLDYINVNGNMLEAEEQTMNTAAWDGGCGGGTLTEWMHCNGYIGFLGYDPNARKAFELSSDEEPDTSVSLFPNPASHTLSVILEKSEPTTLSFYSITGDLVNMETINQSTEINISKLKAGLYFVRIEAKDFITTQKLLKK